MTTDDAKSLPPVEELFIAYFPDGSRAGMFASELDALRYLYNGALNELAALRTAVRIHRDSRDTYTSLGDLHNADRDLWQHLPNTSEEPPK